MPQRPDRHRKLPSSKVKTSPRVIVNLRVSPEWREWIVGLAKLNRTSFAQLIDDAVVDYARSIGFDIEPPQR